MDQKIVNKFVESQLRLLEEIGFIKLTKTGPDGSWRVDVLVNQKTYFPSGPARSAISPVKVLGGVNLELFEGDRYQFASSDMQEFMDAWNGTIVLPKIVSMTGRQKLLHDAMHDSFFRENWREGIKRVAASKFCRGHNRQGDGRAWKATVEWFLQPASLPRIMEGKYDDRNEPTLLPADQKYNIDTI